MAYLRLYFKHVALRKESVDRNTDDEKAEYDKIMSLSARRAWIEILAASYVVFHGLSLSARRAWIEMTL